MPNPACNCDAPGYYPGRVCPACDRPAQTPPRFVAIEKNVMRGSDNWAVARSRTFAKRIANALNHYNPNEKGY